jgi:hypothetical protein
VVKLETIPPLIAARWSFHDQAYDYKQSTTERYPGLSKKKLSFKIKARTCCQVSLHLWVFLLLTIIGWDQEEHVSYDAWKHEATSTTNFDVLRRP